MAPDRQPDDDTILGKIQREVEPPEDRDLDDAVEILFDALAELRAAQDDASRPEPAVNVREALRQTEDARGVISARLADLEGER